MIHRVAAVLPILLALACGGSADRTATGPEVIDSAGIQLVRNGSSDSIAVLEPDLIIGTVDGPEELQFFRITSMAVGMSGRIFVADGSITIREFDTTGAFVRRFGQSGDGPGEFQWPGRIFRYGDTTAVIDSRQYRLSVFVTVRLPAGFRARAAAGRSIYGVLRDEMDVEHVARFTLPAAT
ncbi:MAG TPA: hypothetical protein VHG09_06930 [Longimicrobiales bacterium]|nr:hypothetical protein [Longimicrobiales bacterium]